MLTRAITGFFFIAVLIGSILIGPYTFVALFILIATGCLYEYFGMTVSHPTNNRLILFLSLISCLTLGTLIGLYCLAIIPFFMVWLFVIPTSLLFIIPLFLKDHPQPFSSATHTVGGLWYSAIPFFFFISIGFVKGYYTPYLPLGFLVILWANDTGAYLAGKAFGKRKLFERISPNKTWEGFIGGLFLAFVIALNLPQYFGILNFWQWAIVGLLISTFGTLGDLVESMLKRQAGVKDSGKLLPGHGGLLDRFDGLLLAAPIVFLFLLFL